MVPLIGVQHVHISEFNIPAIVVGVGVLVHGREHSGNDPVAISVHLDNHLDRLTF